MSSSSSSSFEQQNDEHYDKNNDTISNKNKNNNDNDNDNDNNNNNNNDDVECQRTRVEKCKVTTATTATSAKLSSTTAKTKTNNNNDNNNEVIRMMDTSSLLSSSPPPPSSSSLSSSIGVEMTDQKSLSSSSSSSSSSSAAAAAASKSISCNNKPIVTTTTTTNTFKTTLIAKFGKERISLENLPPETTIKNVKDMLRVRTGVLPKRQKLIGLVPNKPKPATTKSAIVAGAGSAAAGKKKKGLLLSDDDTVAELKFKPMKNSNNKNNSSCINDNNKQEQEEEAVAVRSMEFILMGTPEEEIFIDPEHKDDLPDVIDDFDFDFNAGSEMWVRHVANDVNLKKFTESTIIHVMNDPRPNYPLCVLDLDHTLLDFSSKTLKNATSHVVGDATANSLKRPFMDEFLSSTYKYYDLVVWSQTSWRWLETKLTELGMLSNPNYKFCFVLDKTSMFAITSTKRNGDVHQHYVKPLQIIWTKFNNRWNVHNTVHLDDLKRNFALNMKCGLQVTGYYRRKKQHTQHKHKKQDVELKGLAIYLEKLALEATNQFDCVNFDSWMDVVSGKKPLLSSSSLSLSSSSVNNNVLVLDNNNKNVTNGNKSSCCKDDDDDDVDDKKSDYKSAKESSNKNNNDNDDDDNNNNNKNNTK